MFDEITQFVDENKKNPFFLYWATPIPHLPLQAPQRWVDYYVDKFGDEEPYEGVVGRGGYFPCRYPRATYAGMISYLDEQVGMLVQQLKDLGIYENTLIMFTSDNGPIGPYAQWFESAGPFRTESGALKGNVNEGGIRVPMIATWPKVIKPGTSTDHISAAYDLMPTVADITRVKAPADISGISFLPTLQGKVQKQHEFLYWEFPSYTGQMAVRLGNYKALRKNMLKGNLKWELYDLDSDPGELVDISANNPDIIAKVEEIVAREHTESMYERFRFRVLGELVSMAQ
jgi:arylsulfatase A-like enzyme